MTEFKTESSSCCRRDLRRLDKVAPAHGRLVDMGGYRLHLCEDGVGTPAVVLDAGLGCGALDWSLVQPGVAQITRVCSYDRAGLGWSETGPAGHTIRENVEALHVLLSKAGVPPPYVLVGHSMGGLDMQLYAACYPEEVSGMVLVDSSHGRQNVEPGMPRIPGIAPYLLRVLGRLGVVRLLCRGGRIPPSLAPGLGWISEERASVYTSNRHMKATAAELAALPASLAQARGTSWELGQKPLIVLSHGVDLQMPLLSRARTKAMEAAWEDFQKDLVRRSRNSCRTVAARSGHFIPLEQPELVVEAINRVVGSVRGVSPAFPSAVLGRMKPAPVTGPKSLSCLIETLGLKGLRALCQVPMNPDGGPAARTWILLVFAMTAILCAAFGVLQRFVKVTSRWCGEPGL